MALGSDRPPSYADRPKTQRTTWSRCRPPAAPRAPCCGAGRAPQRAVRRAVECAAQFPAQCVAQRVQCAVQCAVQCGVQCGVQCSVQCTALRTTARSAQRGARRCPANACAPAQRGARRDLGRPAGAHGAEQLDDCDPPHGQRAVRVPQPLHLRGVTHPLDLSTAPPGGRGAPFPRRRRRRPLPCPLARRLGGCRRGAWSSPGAPRCACANNHIRFHCNGPGTPAAHGRRAVWRQRRAAKLAPPPSSFVELL